MPGVQIVVQGGPGTFVNVDQALEHDCQVVLVADSGGAAQLLSELVMPLLEQASELPREDHIRENAVQRRIDEYRARRLLEEVIEEGRRLQMRHQPYWATPQCVLKRHLLAGLGSELRMINCMAALNGPLLRLVRP